MRSLDALFDLSHGCQILVELFAILVPQSIAQRLRILQDPIEHARSALESPSFGEGIGVTRTEEAIVYLPWLMKSW